MTDKLVELFDETNGPATKGGGRPAPMPRRKTH
jgi:hypothetical protein